MLDSKFIKCLLQSPSVSNNYWQKKKLKEFINSHHGVLINIGSKDRSLGDDIIYLDIEDGPHVDVVCDIHALPFKGEVINGVIATAILEHVESIRKPWPNAIVFYQ